MRRDATSAERKLAAGRRRYGGVHAIYPKADDVVDAGLVGRAEWMGGLAPESGRWRHAEEGPDDMPAPARAAVTKTSETTLVAAGRLALGTWQALYLWEHRARTHQRRLVVHVAGE